MIQYLWPLLLFVLAGVFEIGGGYMFWLWLQKANSPWLAVIGTVSLALYGVLQTQQTTTFGRTYAAYGGVFVVLSILWGWIVDRVAPDKYDLLGGWIALLGVLVIMYAPRR